MVVVQHGGWGMNRRYGTQDDPRLITLYAPPGERHWGGLGGFRYGMVTHLKFCLGEVERLRGKGDRLAMILDGRCECSGMIAVGRVGE